MKKKKYRTSSVIRALLPGLCVFAAIAAMVFSGLRDTRNAVDQEEVRLAYDSINRAIVTCYAIESRYPASYDYLKQNYGVNIDESRYVVHYEVFAENLRPDVTIVRR